MTIPDDLFLLALDYGHVAQPEEAWVFVNPLLKPPLVQAGLAQRDQLSLVVVQGHRASIAG